MDVKAVINRFKEESKVKCQKVIGFKFKTVEGVYILFLGERLHFHIELTIDYLKIEIFEGGKFLECSNMEFYLPIYDPNKEEGDKDKIDIALEFIETDTIKYDGQSNT